MPRAEARMQWGAYGIDVGYHKAVVSQSMKALIQRVTRGRVTVDDTVTGEIGPGLVVLLGVKDDDVEADAHALAQKTANLRIFTDGQDKMNESVQDTTGSILVVSQFTLYANTRKGNRPSFVQAAPPELAEELYGVYVAVLRRILGEERVATGIFRASMLVELVNDGPLTIELKTERD